jgi:acetone carboxylase gamma subunit
MVLRDVLHGLVSPEWANEIYGVSCDLDPRAVDWRSTELRRETIRNERKRRARPFARVEQRPPGSQTPPKSLARVNPYLSLISLEERLYFGCRCGQFLGEASENYKEHCAWAEVPCRTAGPHTTSVDDFVLREFYCPGCYALLDVEVNSKGAAAEKDLEIRIDQG